MSGTTFWKRKSLYVGVFAHDFQLLAFTGHWSTFFTVYSQTHYSGHTQKSVTVVTVHTSTVERRFEGQHRCQWSHVDLIGLKEGVPLS